MRRSEALETPLQSSEPEMRTGSTSLWVFQGLSGMLVSQARDTDVVSIFPLNSVTAWVGARSEFWTMVDVLYFRKF